MSDSRESALPHRYGDVAPRLAEQGWATIPLHVATKAPAIRWAGRNAVRPTIERVAWEARTFGGHACGIAVPSNVAVLDLDIPEAATQRRVVRIARDLLGDPAMLRVGRAPKLMLFYGADGGVRSTKRHPIEVFAGSGQIVAFGIHPRTGKPYEWHTRSPLHARPEDLRPIVTAEKVSRFLQQVAPVVAHLRPMPAAASVPASTGRDACFASTLRLRALVGIHGGRIADGAAALIAEVGATQTERHNTLVALAGYLLAQRWSAEMIAAFVTHRASAAFGDGDWTREVEKAIAHAQKRQSERFGRERGITWGAE